MDNNEYTGAYFQPAINTAAQGFPAMPPIKKQPKPLSKRDGVFALLYFIASFILVDFGVTKRFHLGFTLSYAFIFALTTVYLYDKSKKPSVFSMLCGVISLFGAATFSLYNNYFINAIMLVLIAGLFTVYAIGLSTAFNFSQGSYKMLFDLFGGVFIQPLESISDVFASTKASLDKKKGNFSAIIGIAVSIPVLIVIIPLLVKSDAAFEGLVNTVVKNIGIYLLELAAAVIIFPYAFSYMFGKRHKEESASKQRTVNVKNRIAVSGCISFLCVISVTYLIYLFSQLAYFFSAFEGILPEGYTKSASEFARRGFFEMFAICAINILIISVVTAFSKRSKGGKVAASVKILSLFISLFSVLLLFTAMQKMKLNISTYGFTRNRLLVSVFMVMMLIVLAFFIAHIFVPKLSYMQPIIIICSCIFVAMSFADIDSFTARYNINAYNSGTIKALDINGIEKLGDPAIPYLIELTESDNRDYAKKAEVSLARYIAFNFDTEGNKREVKIIPEEKDFRSYCKIRNENRALLESFYNDSASNRLKTYVWLFTEDYEYDEKADRFLDYYDDIIYTYNNETNKLDEKKGIEFDEFD